jgi:hypothetical protein
MDSRERPRLSSLFRNLRLPIRLPLVFSFRGGSTAAAFYDRIEHSFLHGREIRHTVYDEIGVAL